MCLSQDRSRGPGQKLQPIHIQPPPPRQRLVTLGLDSRAKEEHCHSLRKEDGSSPPQTQTQTQLQHRHPPPQFMQQEEEEPSPRRQPQKKQQKKPKPKKKKKVNRERRHRYQKPGLTATGNERLFVKHNYHDHANDIDSDPEEDNNGIESTAYSSTLIPAVAKAIKAKEGRAKKAAALGADMTFPMKFYHLLNNAEEEGFQDVVSWFRHGRAFRIHDRKEFEANIMPRYFNQTKITSFQRQLNLYGFQRLTFGPDRGAYYHELFLRGKPFLTKKMVRVRAKGTRYKAASSPDSEPNFYKMPSVGVGSSSNTSSKKSLQLPPPVSPEHRVGPKIAVVSTQKKLLEDNKDIGDASPKRGTVSLKPSTSSLSLDSARRMGCNNGEACLASVDFQPLPSAVAVPAGNNNKVPSFGAAVPPTVVEQLSVSSLSSRGCNEQQDHGRKDEARMTSADCFQQALLPPAVVTPTSNTISFLLSSAVGKGQQQQIHGPAVSQTAAAANDLNWVSPLPLLAQAGASSAIACNSASGGAMSTNASSPPSYFPPPPPLYDPPPCDFLERLTRASVATNLAEESSSRRASEESNMLNNDDNNSVSSPAAAATMNVFDGPSSGFAGARPSYSHHDEQGDRDPPPLPPPTPSTLMKDEGAAAGGATNVLVDGQDDGYGYDVIYGSEDSNNGKLKGEVAAGGEDTLYYGGDTGKDSVVKGQEGGSDDEIFAGGGNDDPHDNGGAKADKIEEGGGFRLFKQQENGKQQQESAELEPTHYTQQQLSNLLASTSQEQRRQQSEEEKQQSSSAGAFCSLKDPRPGASGLPPDVRFVFVPSGEEEEESGSSLSSAAGDEHSTSLSPVRASPKKHPTMDDTTEEEEYDDPMTEEGINNDDGNYEAIFERMLVGEEEELGACSLREEGEKKQQQQWKHQPLPPKKAIFERIAAGEEKYQQQQQPAATITPLPLLRFPTRKEDDATKGKNNRNCNCTSLAATAGADDQEQTTTEDLLLGFAHDWAAPVGEMMMDDDDAAGMMMEGEFSSSSSDDETDSLLAGDTTTAPRPPALEDIIADLDLLMLQNIQDDAHLGRLLDHFIEMP